MSTPGSGRDRPLPIALAIVVTILGVLAMLSGPIPGQRLGLGFRAQIAFATILLALPALLVLARVGSARRAAVGTGVVTRRTLGLSILLGAALWVASVGLIELQSLFVPPPPEYLELFRRLHAALAPTGPVDALVSLLVIAVLPALCEELVMRGVLLTSLAVLIGPSPAVGLTAAVFGLIHFDRIRLLFTFVLGLVLGFLRVRTRSLWPSVATHVTINSLTFALAPLVDDPTQPYTPQPGLGLACLAAGACVAWPLFRALGAGPAPGPPNS
jgi:membrane protease YdiL (CAAX protease family)